MGEYLILNLILFNILISQVPRERFEGKIKGTIIDKETNEPLEYASISLFREKDSTFIIGVLSDKNGEFLINVERPGIYFLRITFLGYEKREIHSLRITPENRILDIGAVPPHLLKKEEAQKLPDIDDLYIDFGVEEKKFDPQKKLGIKIGDPIIPVSEFKILGNKNIYMAKAFDDRVGCALLIRILEEIKNKKIPGTAYFVATVQEEVGLRGAATSPWVFEPDIAIALDVSLTEDTPGAKTETEAKLGGGAAIVSLDYTMVSHKKLRDFLVKVAEKYKIKYHLVTVIRGGYDTGRVHLFKEGVPSSIIGIPSRYVHGFNSMIHRKDFDNALNLCINFLKEFDEKKFKEITSY